MKEMKEQDLWGYLGEMGEKTARERERESTFGLFKEHKEATVLGTFNLSEMGNFWKVSNR